MIGFFPSWDAYSAIFSLESAIDDSQKYMGTKWGHGCLKTYSYRESTWTFRILWYSDAKLSCGQLLYTDGNKILHTLLVKYNNHLLDKQSFERSRDEVTYFYVGDVFCKHLGTMYADFQEKIFAEISGKKFQTFRCVTICIYFLTETRYQASEKYRSKIDRLWICHVWLGASFQSGLNPSL